MSDDDQEIPVVEKKAKKSLKRKLEPKAMTTETGPTPAAAPGGEIRVNPMYNISEIANKARRKEHYAKLKKEKKKVSSLHSWKFILILIVTLLVFLQWVFMILLCYGFCPICGP